MRNQYFIKTGKKAAAIVAALTMFSALAVNGQKRPEIDFVDIPGGTFIMGSPSAEVNHEKDEKCHRVKIDAFQMSRYEITFEQYDAFCEATGNIKPYDEKWGRGQRPVIYVCWDDAKAFAEWMGCRLPTEAEWEYACRAGSTTPFYTGENITTHQANYDGNYPYGDNGKGEYVKRTLPVGSFEPNAWGLYDMAGNVWEWCSDWYGNYPACTLDNPKGAEIGYYRVFRGGSWFDYAGCCRSADRCCNEPHKCDSNVGFRIVKDLP